MFAVIYLSVAVLFSVNVYAENVDYDLKKSDLFKNYESYRTASSTSKAPLLKKDYTIFNKQLFPNKTDSRALEGSNSCAITLEKISPDVTVDMSACKVVLDNLSNEFLSRILCIEENKNKIPCMVTSFNPAQYAGLQYSRLNCLKKAGSEGNFSCSYRGDMAAAYRDMVRVAVVVYDDGKRFAMRLLTENKEFTLPLLVTLKQSEGNSTPLYWETGDGFKIYPSLLTKNAADRIAVCGEHSGSLCQGEINVANCNKEGNVVSAGKTQYCIALKGKKFINSDELVVINPDQIADAEKVGTVTKATQK